MKLEGWIFITFSWTLIIALCIISYSSVLRKKKKQK